MIQREVIKNICEELTHKNRAMFLGYNVANGSQMYGTLKGLPRCRLLEMPCAENLIVGAAVGMALEGKFLPVVCFERHEFAVFALGQLAVLADKFRDVSRVRIPMIVRVILGASKPLDAGAQHTGNYEQVLRQAMPNSTFLSLNCKLTYDDVVSSLESSKSGVVVILEERDGYEQTLA